MAWLFWYFICLRIAGGVAFLKIDHEYSMKVDELYESDDDLILFFNANTPESSDSCDGSGECTPSKFEINETYPVFPSFEEMGLGFYGDHMERCTNSRCDLTVLQSYLNHASSEGLDLDYTAEESYYNATIYLNYRGSFAYKTLVCSKSGQNCAIVLQLNNRPDYTTNFSIALTRWNISTAFDWLTRELYRIPDSSKPVFINVHQLSLGSYRKIMNIIRQMVFQNHKMLDLNIFLVVSSPYFFATQRCEAGRFKPIIHAASAFTNWYTAVKIPPNWKGVVSVLLLSSKTGNSIDIINFAEATSALC